MLDNGGDPARLWSMLSDVLPFARGYDIEEFRCLFGTGALLDDLQDFARSEPQILDSYNQARTRRIQVLTVPIIPQVKQGLPGPIGHGRYRNGLSLPIHDCVRTMGSSLFGYPSHQVRLPTHRSDPSQRIPNHHNRHDTILIEHPVSCDCVFVPQ